MINSTRCVDIVTHSPKRQHSFMFGHMLSALKGVQPELLREHTEPRHPEGRARGQAVCFVTIQLQVASVYHTCSTDGTSRPPDAKCESIVTFLFVTARNMLPCSGKLMQDNMAMTFLRFQCITAWHNVMPISPVARLPGSRVRYGTGMFFFLMQAQISCWPDCAANSSAFLCCQCKPLCLLLSLNLTALCGLQTADVRWQACYGCQDASAVCAIVPMHKESCDIIRNSGSNCHATLHSQLLSAWCIRLQTLFCTCRFSDCTLAGQMLALSSKSNSSAA